MTAAWVSVAADTKLTGGDPVVSVPAGTVDGYLMVAVGSTTGATTFTTPSGWDTHSASLSTATPLWTRTASSEPANYTFVTTGAGNAMVQIVSISAAAAVDAAAGVTGTAGLVIPEVTSAGVDRLLMQLAMKNNATSFTPPGTAAERYDVAPGGAFTYAGGDEIVGSGATGSRTWTPAAGGGPGVAYMLAIAPIAPGAGTFTGGYDFSGSFVGAAGPSEGTFTGGYDFSGSFTGVAPPPTPGGTNRWTPGGRDRFTARRTPKNRRRSR